MALWTSALLRGAGTAVAALTAWQTPTPVDPSVEPSIGGVPTCAEEIFLPLGDGKAIQAEATLPWSDAQDAPPTYYSVTHSGELYKSLSVRETRSRHRLQRKALGVTKRLAALAACPDPATHGETALLFGVDNAQALWLWDEHGEGPWRAAGSAPETAKLRCRDGKLWALGSNGEQWTRGLGEVDSFQSLGSHHVALASETTGLTCTSEPTLSLPHSARLWEGLRPVVTSCSWGADLGQGQVTLRGRYEAGNLKSYRVQAVGNVTEPLLQCLDSKLHAALMHTVTTGSAQLSAELEPPLRLSADLSALELPQNGRAVAFLELHQDYGPALIVSHTSTDLGFLATSSKANAHRTRLYVSAPDTRAQVEGKVVLHTNIAAQPRLEIRVHSVHSVHGGAKRQPTH